MSKIQSFSRIWGGKELIIEVGRFAHAASGSVTVQYGNTMLLVTATMSKSKREGMNWFPLMVDYEEKLYAAGRIKGSRFIKKEGRPTDDAVLVGRFVDRAIRPLFNQKMRNDVQVIATVLSFDKENDPDILALIGASCALSISEIPWNGPIAVGRVGQAEDGSFVLNPTYEQREESKLDLAVAGTAERVLMVEAGCEEVSEEVMKEAFKFVSAELKTPIDLIEDVKRSVGKEKVDPMAAKTDEEVAAKEAEARVIELARPFVEGKIQELFFGAPKATKSERAMAKSQIKDELATYLIDQDVDPEEIKYGIGAVDSMIEDSVSIQIIENDKRVDGRAIDEVRPIQLEVGIIPEVHGTGHFQRGETEVLSILTLGSPGDEQTLDGMEVAGIKRYMHHYNFPPYSVGEVKPMRGPGRRDIGHGALAEKALMPMIPSKEDFPYTIRVVSETLTSNGSSSMGATCGSTLALMDAGVPIKEPVAGVAIGLASNTDMSKWKIVTDIQDLEDGTGGMDFKVAGTKNGINAIQLDTKTIGITQDMVEEALDRAKVARLHILSEMTAVIAEPRSELSPNAPRILKIQINSDKIREVIGPGGKVINEIIDSTGVQAIDIEQDGLVMITSADGESGKKALEWVKSIVAEPEVGKVYEGAEVVRLMDFGAFVEFMPGKQGLVHVSKMAPYHVNRVTDIVKEGDKVNVKLLEIDNQGRMNLSMVDAPGNTYPEPPAGSTRPTRQNGRATGGSRSGGSRPPRGSRKSS